MVRSRKSKASIVGMRSRCGGWNSPDCSTFFPYFFFFFFLFYSGCAFEFSPALLYSLLLHCFLPLSLSLPLSRPLPFLFPTFLSPPLFSFSSTLQAKNQLIFLAGSAAVSCVFRGSFSPPFAWCYMSARVVGAAVCERHRCVSVWTSVCQRCDIGVSADLHS